MKWIRENAPLLLIGGVILFLSLQTRCQNEKVAFLETRVKSLERDVFVQTVTIKGLIFVLKKHNKRLKIPKVKAVPQKIKL